MSPAYEGWEQDPDGSKYFVFGYMNKNWEEELDVPIGAANSFAPGDADRGQPTHFLPRRNRFVFRVPVPKGFSEKDELVWTLTTQGKTTKAYASLRTDYLIDDMVKASETGALGPGTSNPTVRANKPPTVRTEGPRQAKVGEWVTLVATIADDGIPKARSREEFLARSRSPGGRALTIRRPRGGASRRRASRRCASRRREPATGSHQPSVPVAAQQNHGWEEPRTPPVMDCLSWRRCGAVRAGSDQDLGGYARRSEFALGTDLVRAAGAS